VDPEENPPFEVEVVSLLEEVPFSEELPSEEADETLFPPQPANRRVLTLKANISEVFFINILLGI